MRVISRFEFVSTKPFRVGFALSTDKYRELSAGMVPPVLQLYVVESILVSVIKGAIESM